MWRLGSGNLEDEEKGEDDEQIQKMVKLLQEHGWDFTYSRDPLIILIEIEEHRENGEPDE
jgi:nucleotide-binding universal stress UspA family protein